MPATLNPKTLSGIHHSAALQIEGQKAEQARRQQEQAALSKLERIRLDQTQRAQTHLWRCLSQLNSSQGS